jgi:tetratricopeptide (TPR) repeat protein
MILKLIASIAVTLFLSMTSLCLADVDLCAQNAELGRTDEVIRECTKQIKGEVKTDNLSRSYLFRGLAYQVTGRFDEALSDFTKAIKLAPKDDKAYNDRGNTYLIKGRFDQAVSDFNEAIRLNPKNAHAYFNRGPPAILPGRLRWIRQMHAHI